MKPFGPSRNNLLAAGFASALLLLGADPSSGQIATISFPDTVVGQSSTVNCTDPSVGICFNANCSGSGTIQSVSGPSPPFSIGKFNRLTLSQFDGGNCEANPVSLPVAVGPNQILAFQVTFAPSAAGTFAGSLTFSTTGGSGTFDLIGSTGGVTLTVGDLGDTGAPGQLRTLINAAAPGDTIVIPAGTIVLTAQAGGSLDITKTLTLEGAGADLTTIDGGGIDRVIETSGGSVVISGVSIRNGKAGTQGTSGEGITSNGSSAGVGGGISHNSLGPLIVINTAVFGNSASEGGGGIAIGVGSGPVTLTNVTLSGNNTPLFGGGILNAGTMTLTNVTLSGNSANTSGGGIASAAGSTTLTNVTLSGNSANTSGGGIFNQGGTVQLKNTLIAGNTTGGQGPDCFGTLASQGFNLIQSTAGCSIGGVTTGNVTGVSPNLGPLSSNGGPTQTHALLPGSPAIDAVTSGCPPPSTDQRGVARPGGSACDIGAYEATAAGAGATGTFGYVVNAGTNSVSVINTATHNVVTTVPVGQGASRVAFSPSAAFAYVTNFSASTVSVINTATHTVLTTIPVGLAPQGVAFSPAGGLAYVTNVGANTVSVLNTATHSVITNVPVGQEPRGVAFSPNGALAYVANFASHTVSVINTATHSVITSVPVGQAPFYLAFSPTGDIAYVTNFFSNTVSVLNTATHSVITTVPVGSAPEAVAFSPTGGFAVVVNSDFSASSVSVLNPTTHTVITTLPIGQGPKGIAFSPTGSFAYMTNFLSNTVSVLNTATHSVITTVPVGQGPVGIAITPSVAAAFVTRLYQTVLDRAPDPAGLQAFLDQIAQFGSVVPTVLAFFHSPEFLARNTSDAEFLTICYRTFLNREPDPAGFTAFLTALQTDQFTRDNLLDIFIDSQEFASQASFLPPLDPVTAFVTTLYVRILGRGPDQAGLTGFVTQLNQTRTVLPTVQFFLSSPEFLARNTTNTEFVTLLYRVFLDRVPDAAGLATFVAQLTNGTATRNQLVLLFAASPEFQTIQQTLFP